MHFDDFEDMLRHLRKLGDAFEEGQEFPDRLEAYKDAGWPLGRETEAFLLWSQFEMETTVN